MALSKNIATEFGVDAAYWRIIGMQTYYDDALVDVALAGYASADARHGGKVPLATISGIRLSWADMSLEGDNEPSRETAYAAIKVLANGGDERLSLLAGATDC